MKKGLPLPLKLLLGIIIGGAIGIWAWKSKDLTFAQNLMQFIV